MNLRKLLLVVSVLLASVTLWAQSRTVTGTVVGTDGLAIPGAYVLVKGTTTGTVTDMDGKYRINVPEGSETLVFRIIGMVDQEQDINGRTEVNATMEAENEELNEVIVVAYGTTKKEAFTGSASVVRSEELSKKITTSVGDALVGSVAGLQMRGSNGAPGSDNGKILIRGIASMYAQTDPLVIVDGAPYSASLSNIPPEDVESVSILKDAASAALYGARGAAGVIIVTTKRGKAGDAQINVEAKWGGNSRAVQDYETITDPGKYYEVAYAKYNNYYYYGLGQSASEANANANSKMIEDLGYQVYSVPFGEQLIGLDGKLNSNATLGYQETTEDGVTYYYQPDDWTDAAYRHSFRQEYTISVNGGTEKGAYYMSLGYLNDDGIIEHSGYERVAARLKADYQAKTWLRVGANIGYVHSNTKSNPNLDSSALGSTNLMYYTSMIAPIYPIYVRVVENGNVVIRTDENGNPQYDYGRPGTDYPQARAFLQTGNPLGSNNYNEVVTIGNQLNGTFNADIDFTEWLRFNATSNVNWGSSQFSDYENSLYGPKVGVNGEITKTSTTSFRTNNTQTLTYYDTFADVHNINWLLGHEYYDTKTKYIEAVAQGMFSPEIKEIDAAANNQVSSRSYTNEYNVEGIFTSLQYNYDEKYYLSGSYRRDASSRFAKENRWGNFWSVGAAWIINKESFFPETEWVNLLKLKLSIGQQGNDNLPNSYYWIDTYNLSPSSTTTMSPSLRTKGNKDITWETSTNMNTGVEFTLFGGRLNGSFDLYDKKTTDLLFWLSVPESTGARGYYGNLGDISNKGFELVLTGSVFRTDNIDITISANASHNKTSIDKLPESKTKQYGGFAETNNNIQMWYEEGGELYCPFLYSYAGVSEKGEALYYYDEDLSPLGGKVSTNNTSKAGSKRSGVTTELDKATRYAFKSTLPKIFGGFSLSATVYGFDLSASFDYQLGGKVYDSQYRSLMSGDFSNGYAVHKDILNSWTPNNTSTDIPRQFYGDNYTTASSDRWLTNASYLNFQSFTVGYTMPEDLVKRFYLSKVRFFCSGENLQFWSARQGLDPRYSFEGNESIAQYSPARTIMGGVQVSF
ncbi:MAG: SusC/RagA family TonB-linked outer membrane protein [Bacteroidales bacterium]|jgi:TonB-linked SusC/RagA family outer membrane protein|nr:SusC/RagA family TonB-linked outer membrane protein [Bacteroidales bacterium]